MSRTVLRSDPPETSSGEMCNRGPHDGMALSFYKMKGAELQQCGYAILEGFSDLIDARVDVFCSENPKQLQSSELVAFVANCARLVTEIH